MDEAALYNELLEHLGRAGLEIRLESFKRPPESAGGLCRFQGKRLVLLHSGASKPERARALLEVVEQVGLSKLGLNGNDLSPPLLARLNRRGQMPWPHKQEAPPLAKPDYTPASPLKLVHTTPPLSSRTTLGVGGHATHFVSADTDGAVLEAVRAARERGTPLYPLGGGSNVVIADEGVEGTVLEVAICGVKIERKGDLAVVTAGAGENWHDFADKMTRQGFAGVECLGGIPGAVGATPIQNVGAYGQEVSQTITRVRALHRETGEIEEFDRERCEFSYRNSIFKQALRDRYVVLDVTFELKINGAPYVRYGELKNTLEARGNPAPSLDEVFETVVRLRRAKSMVLDPKDPNRRSCGSFFVNVQVSSDEAKRISEIAGIDVPQFPGEGGLVKLPAAWLIEKAGLEKGVRHGPVGLSTKHTLAIVAHENATAEHVTGFARFVRETVEKKFGVRLIPEPHFWGFGSLEDGLPT